MQEGNFKMNVLFVGNGINRFANIVPGWSELFSKAVNIDGFKMQKSLTPTMEYDLNTHLILDRDPTKKSTDIKRSIAAYLKGILFSRKSEYKRNSLQQGKIPNFGCTPNFPYPWRNFLSIFDLFRLCTLHRKHSIYSLRAD